MLERRVRIRAISYLDQVDRGNKDVGLEQAKALSAADLKIIANEGSVSNGLSKISDVLSSKGNSASMLEGLNQSEIGKGLIDKFIKPNGDSSKK